MLENDLSPNLNDKTVYLKDYKAPDFLIESVTLEANLGDSSTEVVAELSIKRNGEHDKPLVLDGETLQLLGVKLNGLNG